MLERLRVSSEPSTVAAGIAPGDPRVDRLRLKLARSERRREVLEEVILALDLDLELEELLDRVVSVVAAATASDAGFVYMWEEETDRLVLRAATEGDQKPFLGTIRLRLGEGVTGWSAETRQPAMINANPVEDARFSHYTELKEERFRAMLTAPIVVRGDTVVGVFTLYSKRTGHFDDEHMQTAIEVAHLLAGAIDRAHLRDQDARKAKALAFLGDLMSVLASTEPIERIVDSVIAITLDAMAAELCLVVLFDPTDVRLAMRGSGSGASGDTGAVAHEAIEQRVLRVIEDREEEKSVPPRVFEELALCPPERISELATASLIAGSEQLGFMNCYRSRRYSPEERQLLATVADRVALTVKVRRLTAAVLEQSPAWRLHRLLIAGTLDSQIASLAAALGCDLSKPHVVVKARLLGVPGDDRQDDLPERINRGCTNLARLITTSNPASIVHCGDGRIVGLVRIPGMDTVEGLRKRLEEVRSDMEARLRVRMSAGVSTVAMEPGGYADAYREAKEALEIGSSLWGEGRLIAYEDLGPYVYLYRISADPGVGRDPAMGKITPLVEYDQKKGSQLLETLDCYLECRGNASVAAERLIVHRNTLRQRLARIEELTGIDLARTDDWFALQFASKLMKLRFAGSEGRRLKRPQVRSLDR